MALAIKAIPTLYGDEARRFREMAEEVEKNTICDRNETLKKMYVIVPCAKFLIDRILIKARY